MTFLIERFKLKIIPLVAELFFDWHHGILHNLFTGQDTDPDQWKAIWKTIITKVSYSHHNVVFKCKMYVNRHLKVCQWTSACVKTWLKWMDTVPLKCLCLAAVLFYHDDNEAAKLASIELKLCSFPIQAWSLISMQQYKNLFCIQSPALLTPH